MYGFEEEVVQGNSGKFGLNQRALMSKFELTTYGDASNEALDVSFMVEGKEFRSRYFPIERLWDKTGNELTDKTSSEYKEAATQAGKTLSATLVSIIRCFVDENKLKTALKTPFATFSEYANVLIGCLNDNPMWNVEEVDLFLEYQKKPSKDQEKSYLQVPQDTRQGSFICKSLKGEFTEVKTDYGITYKDQLDYVHPFKRNKWYIESPYYIRTDFSNKQSKTETPVTDTPTW